MRTLLLFLLLTCYYILPAQQASRIVYELNDGCLAYVADENNNYLPDYSYAGYRYGEEVLPDVPVVKRIQSIIGDNTSHIQQALDEVALMPLDSNGCRGALLLEAGIYRIDGSVTVRESGIVLRGVGQGTDSMTNTILLATGTDTRDVVRVGHAPNVSNSWRTRLPNTSSNIISEYLPAGSRTIAVEDPTLYAIGDNIIIYQPSTATWLASINYGDTASDAPWQVGDIDLYYNRVITAIDVEKQKLVLDVPIYDHLDRALAQSEVYRYDRSAIKTKVGVENLRIVIETAGEEDEAHARSAITLNGTEDSWVRDVTALHFTYAGVDVSRSNRVTIKDCTAIEPHSMVTGGRRYNFAVGRLSNNILFDNCYANRGRHAYTSNGASEVAGIVFYNCRSEEDLSTIEGHRRWSQALLYDNLEATNPQTNRVFALYNRGDFGTGHGWSAVHSTAWNIQISDGKAMIVQRPPGRQNYSIGAKASFNIAAPFFHPNGWIELTQQELAIPSLYQKQLELRMAQGAVLDAPARLTATVIAKDKVKLEWLDVASDENVYQIEYRRASDGILLGLIVIAANSTTYTHDLEENAQLPLIYRVQALDEDCNSPYSNPVLVDQTTAINSVLVEDTLIVPNPFSNQLLIEKDAPIQEIAVYNATGIRIFHSLKPVKDIDTSAWSSGTYVLKLSYQNGQTSIRQLVKN
jgi:hypothetical protein